MNHDPERMRWEGDRLMLGDDELAVIADDHRDAHIRICLTCFRNARGMFPRRPWTIAKVRAEVETRIRQGRAALLSRAEEDAALARRIATAKFPEETE